MDTTTQHASHITLSAVRRDLVNVNDKIDSVRQRVELMQLGLSPVPEKISDITVDMDEKAQRLAELEKRNKLHSAQLKLLQKEIQYEHMRNDVMMDQYRHPGEDGLAYQHSPRGQNGLQNTYHDPRMNAPPRSPVKEYPNAQNGAPVGEQQRSEAVRSPMKPSNAQRPHEADPRFRQHNTPSQNANNPNTNAANTSVTGNTFDFDKMTQERQSKIYSAHDATAINPQLWEKKSTHKKYPWYDHESHPYPGGFLFIRFDDSGYSIMNNALKIQDSVCRHTGGYLMGIARSDKIYVYEMATPNKQQNWTVSRQQDRDRPDVIKTANSVAVFWFTKKEAAEGYFENGHRNRLREPCFPTPNGFEAYYTPLLSAPPMRPYNTFLFIEILLPPRRQETSNENLTQFEAEMRENLSRLIPGCLPMVVSAQTGRVIFKPGLFLSPYSKLFISRFESQRDVDEVMRSGMIPHMRRKWGFTGDANVFSMTMESNF